VLLALVRDAVRRGRTLLRGTGADRISIDAVSNMVRSIDGFQLKELASERLSSYMAHATRMLDFHGPWYSCQTDSVWKLIGGNERDEVSVASRDEVEEAR